MRHTLRLVLLTLAFLLIGLALAPKATPSYAAGTAADTGSDSLAYTSSIQVGPAPPAAICAYQSFPVRLAGVLPNDCKWRYEKIELIPVESIVPSPPIVRVTVGFARDCAFPYECTPPGVPLSWDADARLPGLPAGAYQLHLQLVVRNSCLAGPDSVSDAYRAFTVVDGCPPGPSLPPGVPGFVDRIRIGDVPPCDTCPPRICPDRPIPFEIAGAFADGSWHFRGIELLPSPLESPRAEPQVVRVLVDHVTCVPAIQVAPTWSADTMLAGLPAGDYQLLLEFRIRTLCAISDSAGYVVSDSTSHASLPFTVPQVCAPAPVRFVQDVRIGFPSCEGCPPVVCPDQRIPLRISGTFPDACYQILGVDLVPQLPTVIGPPTVRIRVEDRSACVTCGRPTEPLPWSVDTLLAGLPPGSYVLPVEVVVNTLGQACTPGVVTTEVTTRAFTVSDSCPGPVPGPLPYTNVIRIGAPCVQTMRNVTGDCPVCANQPIPFLAAGEFPTNCYQFRGIQVLDMSESPVPRPPVVRIVIAVNDCMRWACARGAVPWEGHAILPPLPPGSYQLPVQVALVSMCDSTRVDSLYATSVPFTVQDTCGGPSAPCLFADWDHLGRVGGCDAFVGPGEPASVRMILATPVPLAGLQGRVALWPPGLRIANLEPIGPAAGMKLTWRPDTSGAAFVMFAESGAPIVPVRCDSNARCLSPAVLAVTVVAPPGVPIAPVTHLSLRSVFGSDSLGGAVPECPIMTFAARTAEICSGASSCDVNGDGHLDVRDLVTMVHCVLRTGPCPDSSQAALDCDADGQLGVDDVLCCAREVLHWGERDTTGTRNEPGVSVALGEPQWRGGALGVPLALDGADRVGAARLALALPLDRYDVTAVDLGEAASQWLEVHEVVDGRLVLGLIGLAPAGTAPARLPLSITLALKPGRDAGGDLALADAQFSGPDGVTLVTPQTQPVVPLPSPGALRLAAPRPNPFTTRTQFSLALSRAAEVEISVHDLSGRRVATLQRGPLGAGPHEYAWTGARDDGSVAPDGIYFVHARVGGERLAQKVVFLRGR